MMDNCKPHCIDLLELLAQLAAKVDYLYLFYRNLSLSDLVDVKDCLSPLKDLHLVFDGHLWDAENQNQATLTVEPLLDSGVAIAKITFNGDTTTLYCKDGTRVEVTPKPITGSTMDIATITVDGVTETIKSKDFTGDINIINLNIENINGNIRTILGDITDIYNIINNLHNTEVIVTPLKTSGEKIATISVDGVVKELYAPTQVSDGILNIKINNIDGTVSNRIASLTLTGADINITGYTESEDVNDDLELSPTDTVNEAFGKLAKALKDDEKVITAAFHTLKEATGFDTNLHYVPETGDSILGEATDLLTADRLIKDFLKNLMDHVANITDNQGIRFSGGVSGTFNMTDTNAYGRGYLHEFKFPLFAVINVTNNYPIHEYVGESAPNYYDLSIVQGLIDNPNDVLFIVGGLYTWEVSAGVWELWLFTGQHTAVSWKDNNNWVKRW